MRTLKMPARFYVNVSLGFYWTGNHEVWKLAFVCVLWTEGPVKLISGQGKYKPELNVNTISSRTTITL